MSDYDIRSQHLNFDGLLNSRELGGMPLQNGGTFREKIAIRSDSPSGLTKEQCAKIVSYGVNLVIDLRSPGEVRHYGNPFKDIPEVRFYNIPLIMGDPDQASDPTIVFLRTHKLGDFYVLILQKLGDRICNVLRLISDNTSGITMYHCAHGKDRTGVISAFLYLLAGASREDIIRNYECSYEFMRPILDPAVEAIEPGLKHILNSDRENMIILLDYIDSVYGGDITKYLLENGMTKDEIDKLRSRLI